MEADASKSPGLLESFRENGLNLHGLRVTGLLSDRFDTTNGILAPKGARQALVYRWFTAAQGPCASAG